MSYLVSVDFPCKEGMAETVEGMLRGALKDTRAFDGCQSIDVYFEEDTNTFTALEVWDSADHYRVYQKFRTDQGIAEALAPVIEGGWEGVVAAVKWLGPKTDI
ncbi:MAG: antibiotic biosynthesis monooxygenase [Pseudomonadota bacterium]